MVFLHLPHDSQEDCLRKLESAADDASDCALTLSGGVVSVTVAEAIRDTLRSDPFNKKWKVRISECAVSGDAAAFALSQALSAKIRTISVVGKVRSKSACKSVVFCPETFEHLSSTLEEVSLAGAFQLSIADSASVWLSKLTSLRKLVWEVGGGSSAFSVHVFQLLSAHQHHPRKLVIRGTNVTCDLLEPLQGWSGLEDLRIFCCDFKSCMTLPRLSQLISLRVVSRHPGSYLCAKSIFELLSQDSSRLVSLRLSDDILSIYEFKSLVKAMSINKTLEKGQLANKKSSCLIRPFIIRNIACKRMFGHNDLPAGLWALILGSIGHIPSEIYKRDAEDACRDALYSLLRQCDFLFLRSSQSALKRKASLMS